MFSLVTHNVSYVSDDREDSGISVVFGPLKLCLSLEVAVVVANEA